MKRLLFNSLSILFLITCLSSCAPTKEEAMNYNDKIIKEQKKVIKAENEVISAIKDKNMDILVVQGLNEGLSRQVDESIAAIEKLEKFDGNTDFKDAALKFMKIYREVVSKDYKAWIDNLKIPIDKLTNEDLSQEKIIVADLNRKLNNANADFVNAQKDFALKYKFTLSKF
jgi:hypothetical protein